MKIQITSTKTWKWLCQVGRPLGNLWLCHIKYSQWSCHYSKPLGELEQLQNDDSWILDLAIICLSVSLNNSKSNRLRAKWIWMPQRLWTRSTASRFTSCKIRPKDPRFTINKTIVCWQTIFENVHSVNWFHEIYFKRIYFFSLVTRN